MTLNKKNSENVSFDFFQFSSLTPSMTDKEKWEVINRNETIHLPKELNASQKIDILNHYLFCLNHTEQDFTKDGISKKQK